MPQLNDYLHDIAHSAPSMVIARHYEPQSIAIRKWLIVSVVRDECGFTVKLWVNLAHGQGNDISIATRDHDRVAQMGTF